ncbi:MAG: SH3 domain-containing protein [Gammaproteobacteria bacterium]|nr:SH3 domain-containing protein [Gammaproteobacteria bacterium]MBU1979810.1 SH3 domain-containing protein [Gammaproteobacteria bacterium]
MHSTRYLHILLAAVLLAAPIAHAGEGSAAVKADELKAEPFRDAKTVGKLTAGDKVEILKKDGGWFQVKSARGNGWVRMLSIRRGVSRKASTGSEIAGLAGLASGRAGTGRVVATTGIRGLNEEELKAAKYNETELKLAESSLTSRAEAKKFAAKGKLTARKLDYLPDPAEGEQP